MKKTTLLVGLMLSTASVFSQKQEATMPRFNSDAEKAAWIANHPEDYERMTGEKVTNVIPEFKTQAEKDAWLQQLNPKKEVSAEKANIESSISTEAEKDAYLREHPNTVYITLEEFNALPEGKKASVLADKNYVIIK
jgi:hypothetical protein